MPALKDWQVSENKRTRPTFHFGLVTAPADVHHEGVGQVSRHMEVRQAEVVNERLNARIP
jgi:hypothetical protein